MSVTVIMTTYNCGEYISQAIKSVLNQTYKDFELLIIDDGSTDNTEHIVKRFDDKRINYFKIEHIGYSSAINIGLNRAKYDWVSFCDADDIIHPQKILQQFQLIKKGNNLIYTNTAFFKKNKILYELSTKNNLQLINKKIALHGHLGPSVMYNRKFILNRGAHNSNLIAFGDYELLLRILNDIEIIILPEFFYYQRLRNNSMSTTETMKKKNLIYKIQKPYFDKLSEHFGITSSKEQLMIKGWREFFYGDKNLARKYWIEAGLNQWNIKLLITFLLSYLPEKFLDYLKDKRIRLRLEYQIQRLLSRNDIQNEFDKVLGLIGE
ncbi:glycosyltransferase family 2 protein [Stygiobacter electus]|jgi:glycosyltransferase involved in cell wall biosynthesis|uniref:Glycosyltransferase family 2 protein n=1 Tax=Stygiobacter electus TaxID=3032292 RepID=A0AAE3P291_9BACT|nr:glycosyltransferase family 2 protein [Stygiobacter electus]MDF1611500.1 glycosyltransferase family 2 protein [Stygiobacter electus]